MSDTLDTGCTPAPDDGAPPDRKVWVTPRVVLSELVEHTEKFANPTETSPVTIPYGTS